MGLQLNAADIDGTSNTNNEKLSISKALVSFVPAGMGGTGSFISREGLIITNWHVAHNAVRVASLEANKGFLETGFSTNTEED